MLSDGYEVYWDDYIIDIRHYIMSNHWVVQVKLTEHCMSTVTEK